MSKISLRDLQAVQLLLSDPVNYHRGFTYLEILIRKKMELGLPESPLYDASNDQINDKKKAVDKILLEVSA